MILNINDLIERIDKTCIKNGKVLTQVLRNKKIIYESLIHHTGFLPESAGYSERIFCLKNNIKSRVKCPLTGAPLKWDANKRYYRKSKEQSKLDPKKKDTIKAITKIREKKRKAQSLLIENCLSHNNFNICTKNEVLKFVERRVNETNLGRDKNLIYNNHLFENYDILCSLIYYTQRASTKSWSERFYMILNNIESPPEQYNDNISAVFENLVVGYRRVLKPRSWKGKAQQVSDFVLDRGFIIKNETFPLTLAEVFNLECIECGETKTITFDSGKWKTLICNNCTGLGRGRSLGEDNIVEFLKNDLGIKAVDTNVKIPGSYLEIDIFLPDHNIGIEYHGVLWHSFGSNFPSNSDLEIGNKKKHYRKFKLCEENNIRLIQIFDTEWMCKPDLIKSMLKSKLGKTSDRIHARKTKIKILTPAEEKQFFNVNHNQGYRRSDIAYGLIYNDEIVCAMSFGKNIKHRDQKELIRFASKIDTTVVGGGSKIFKKYIAEHNPKSILSYCDLRFSNGNVYERLGFKKSHISPPNYFYTQDCKLLESRHKYQKQKLKRYDNYSDDKTESQIMYENGFRKIYDAGNLVYYYN